MKKLLLALSIVLLLLSCNDEDMEKDKDSFVNPLIGTWEAEVEIVTEFDAKGMPVQKNPAFVQTSVLTQKWTFYEKGNFIYEYKKIQKYDNIDILTEQAREKYKEQGFLVEGRPRYETGKYTVNKEYFILLSADDWTIPPEGFRIDYQIDDEGFLCLSFSTESTDYIPYMSLRSREPTRHKKINQE